MISEGWNSSKIADVFDVSPWSVVEWIRRVNEEGFYGLE
ncbi:MAG: helix-turn-helix domain-containing protein [Candidatus Hodarchaeota archaeon]